MPTLILAQKVASKMQPLSLEGFRVYTSHKWMIDRDRLLKSCVCLDNGNAAQLFIIDINEQSDQIIGIFREFEADKLVPYEIAQGTVMIQPLSLPEFVPVEVNFEDRMNWIAQVNLCQFGLISKPNWSPVPPDVEVRFNEIFKIEHPKLPIHNAVHVLVTMCQQALFIFGFLKDSAWIDGIACTRTMSAFEQFYFEFGPFKVFSTHVKPWHDILMIYHVLDYIYTLRKKLKTLGFAIPRQYRKTDPNSFRKQIKHFQKSRGLETTLLFDTPTLARIRLEESKKGTYWTRNQEPD